MISAMIKKPDLICIVLHLLIWAEASRLVCRHEYGCKFMGTLCIKDKDKTQSGMKRGDICEKKRRPKEILTLNLFQCLKGRIFELMQISQ